MRRSPLERLEEDESPIEDLKAMGVEVPDEMREEIESAIEELGEDFFENIEGGNNIYWHFTPFGEEVIHSGKVVPGEKSEKRTTADHSNAVHFVAPGIDARHALADIDYTRYATHSRMNFKGERIGGLIGLAIAFPADYLAKVTPYRQMARSKNQGDLTRSDVAFLKSDKKSEAFDYEYDLKEAYIMPHDRMVEDSGASEDPRFKHLYTSESRQRLAENNSYPALEVLKIILKENGYSEDWIEEHLISTFRTDEDSQVAEGYDKYSMDNGPGYGLPKRIENLGSVVRLTAASKIVRKKLGKDKDVVVPLSRTRGRLVEHTDEDGDVYLEKLAVLSAREDSNLQPTA